MKSSPPRFQDFKRCRVIVPFVSFVFLGCEFDPIFSIELREEDIRLCGRVHLGQVNPLRQSDRLGEYLPAADDEDFAFPTLAC